MKKMLSPGTLHGEVSAPSSKSQTHRLLICAALADKPTIIYCDTMSADIEATISCLRALGAVINIEHSSACADYTGIEGSIKTVNKIYVEPLNRTVRLSELKPVQLDCHESGSTLRFLLPVAAAIESGIEKMAAIECVREFTGTGRLAERPLSPLYEELEKHGCCMSPQGSFPLKLSGQLAAGEYTMSGDTSSQFFSGLLFALPLLKEDSVIRVVGHMESAPYVRMTIAALRSFGVIISEQEGLFHIRGGQGYKSPGELRVEGDWSNAAFWLVGGAIAAPYGLLCKGLNTNSLQGDMQIIEILREFGAELEVHESNAGTSGSIYIRRSVLHGIDIDVSDVPDLAPILAVAGAAASGTTRILNGKRLRLKESDRLAAVADMLRRLSVEVEESDDSLKITGMGSLHGELLVSQNDHRMAMAGAIAALCADDSIVLEGAEAVAKSYPDFFEVYEELVTPEDVK